MLLSHPLAFPSPVQVSHVRRRYTPAAVDVKERPLEGEAAAHEGLPAEHDAALVAAIARGDALALETAYTLHSRAVYSLALHLLSDTAPAEEVVQETFLKLWRQPGAYQAQRGKLVAWLLGVAHHHAVDLLRRRSLEQRHKAMPLVMQNGHIEHFEHLGLRSSEGDPLSSLGAREQQHLVSEALQTLPREQRVPLELAYYRGLTQVEIADQLNEPLGTVKTRMRLGLLRLRQAPALVELWRSV
jgi:RNA polymerase sigma-70 factor (ECF subfamily)